jgi:hypothetical protein
MADIADIRQALADALSTVQGTQTSAYNLANPTMPCLLVIGHNEIDYGNLAFGRGDTQWNLIVRGYVSTTWDIGSQQRLDRWLASDGTESVKAAVEADPELGGVADWAIVLRSTGTNVFTLPNSISALGTDFTVQVQTSS